MARRARTLSLALAASLAYGSSAGASDLVTIAVDARHPGPRLRPVWAFYGYDEVNYTTTAAGKDLLRLLGRTHESPYVRTHFLFNSGDGTPALKWGSTNLYTEDANGAPRYHYALIDRVLDAQLAAGTLPLFEIGFMPEALSSHPQPYQNSNTYVLDGGAFYPPSDFERWGELVRTWATHVKERYPDAESRWLWELWNEPDIGYWKGTFEEYAQLYDTTEAALHAVLPDARLGGPAVANPENDFLARFLEHCASGTHAVHGGTGSRLDLVSFHAKGGVNFLDGQLQLDLGNQLRLHRLGFETIARSAFRTTDVVLSEADPDGCAACPLSTAPASAYRHSPAYGAYEVAMMKRTLDLAETLDIELRGVVTWAFTFPDAPYFAGYRALTTRGVRLPVFNAFALLAHLKGQRLPVESSGARPLADLLAAGVRDEPDVDALAASDGERVRVLVWNYHDDLVPADPAEVTLTVRVPEGFGPHALVTHTRVDEEHGDAHAAWQAQGAPETPSEQQLTELREAMKPVVLAREQLAVSAGTVTLRFELPRYGLSLFTLEPATPSERDAPAAHEPGCSLGPTGATRYAWACALLLTAFAGRSARRRCRSSRGPRA